MVDSNQRVVSRKRGQYGAGLVVLSLQKKMVLRRFLTEKMGERRDDPMR